LIKMFGSWFLSAVLAAHNKQFSLVPLSFAGDGQFLLEDLV